MAAIAAVEWVGMSREVKAIRMQVTADITNILSDS